MTYFQAAILGIVQGLTEFLPISSTAHLLIGGRLLGHDDPGGVFTVMIQFGAILAVMWLYRAKIVQVVLGLPSSASARRFATMIVVAFIPAAVAGVLLEHRIKSILYYSPGVIGAAFIIGGIVILLVERSRPQPTVTDVDRVPLPTALAVGASQAVALIPGVSRSGATLTVAMFLGLRREAAARFVFLLSLPAVLAAAIKEGMEVSKVGVEGLPVTLFLVGLVVSGVVGYITVKYFIRYLAGHTLHGFAIYRLLLAGFTVAWLLARQG